MQNFKHFAGVMPQDPRGERGRPLSAPVSAVPDATLTPPKLQLILPSSQTLDITLIYVSYRYRIQTSRH
jgi:hypothetical protein